MEYLWKPGNLSVIVGLATLLIVAAPTFFTARWLVRRLEKQMQTALDLAGRLRGILGVFYSVIFQHKWGRWLVCLVTSLLLWWGLIGQLCITAPMRSRIAYVIEIRPDLTAEYLQVFTWNNDFGPLEGDKLYVANNSTLTYTFTATNHLYPLPTAESAPDTPLSSPDTTTDSIPDSTLKFSLESFPVCTVPPRATTLITDDVPYSIVYSPVPED